MKQLATFAILGFALLVRADEPSERQREIQLETERLARRVSTMLRVMEYHQLDKSAEKQMLQEVVTTLSGLSREQMTSVIAKLDAAANEKDPTKSQAETDAAYARHREIMTRLRGLLSVYDAVRTLDQAAERLIRAARDQLELALQTTALIADTIDGKSDDDPNGMRRRLDARRGLPSLSARGPRMADDQTDFVHELERVWSQVVGLRSALPADQAERLQKTDNAGSTKRVLSLLGAACDDLREQGSLEDRRDAWVKAMVKQWRAANVLLETGHALRGPRERMQALSESRQLLGKLLADQEALLAATRSAPQSQRRTEADEPPREDFGRRGFGRGRMFEPVDEAGVKRRELADMQGRFELTAHDALCLIKPHAADVAEMVLPVETAQRDVQIPLRAGKLADAAANEEQAVAALKTVINELDRLIREAELLKQDPLAAVQKALETLEALIRDQREAKERTKAATEAKNDERLAKLAKQQADLTKRTDELRQTPLPAKPETLNELSRATGAMARATQELKKPDGETAQKQQTEALQALEEARRQLAEQMAAIEQRREEVKKLEEAAKKVAELARQEKAVADAAKKMPDMPAADDVKKAADKQGELIPPTQEVRESTKSMNADAAKKLDEAAKKMDQAQKDLGKRDAKPAGENADKATQDLLDAHKELTKTLDQKKGEEFADQAQMQPNKVDPAQAAREIAKALQLTNQAKMEADQAQADKSALQRSQRATQAAQSAVGQARAQAPQGVQKQLGQASQQLARANQAAEQGNPKAAGEAQTQAAQSLAEALGAMQAAAAAMQARGQQPGQQPGQEPGQQPGQGQPPGQGQQAQRPGQQPGTAPENNQQQATGNRVADGKVNFSASGANGMAGDGTFLQLPARQRDLIKQAMGDKLPADYAAAIQQYFVNIAKGKPAAKPGEPAKP